MVFTHSRECNPSLGHARKRRERERKREREIEREQGREILLSVTKLAFISLC